MTACYGAIDSNAVYEHSSCAAVVAADLLSPRMAQSLARPGRGTRQMQSPSRMPPMSLRNPPSNYINGRFEAIPGSAIQSRNPAQPDQMIWSGNPGEAAVDQAVGAARNAFAAWSATSFEQRAALLRKWAEITTANAQRIAELITDEMGKTIGESLIEARALGEKVNITLDQISLGRVTDYEVPVSSSRIGLCKFKPHGVMAVI